ncbi:MAG: GNAT family N-acetyltransferase [Thermosynechococcaceae cyanobacterium MS004]|nr:GNAT family N-acetyltransferase [Thermosynechococcaceae cyanobacterium MS004]
MISLDLNALPERLRSAAVALDQVTLGGLWTAESYLQEMQKPSSDLLGIWPAQEVQAQVQAQIQTQVQAQGTQPLSSSSMASSMPLQIPLWGVGCAWSILDEAHIVLLAVHPELRHQGFGLALLLGLLDCARDRGSHYATLEVNAANSGAIALYEKLGFKTAGRRPGYYSTPHVEGGSARRSERGSTRDAEDALILWRSGLQSECFQQQRNQHWQILKARWAKQSWQLAHPD